jgi:hypothetical protein
MGSELVELTKCACCDKCPVDVGGGKRFRAAAETVLSKREASKLYKMAYDLRSKTAHEGQLHGTESALGWADFTMFRADVQDLFESTAVGILRRTSGESSSRH